MEQVSFAALPLHDAVVRDIELSWANKRCCFHLSAFARGGVDATPHMLVFEGVRLLSMPHNEPWGPSSCVNAVSEAGGTFRIEMQSGDVIELTAASFAFYAL